MFEKFGEFDSAEELNRAAVAQRTEGDMISLKLLAEENGIEAADLEDFMDGYTDELVTPLTAATAKIAAEIKDLKISGVLKDWTDELMVECEESPDLCAAVRKKGKRLEEYMAKLADHGFEHRAVVDKSIVKHCSKALKDIVGTHEFYIGVPDKRTRKKLMYEYYLGR